MLHDRARIFVHAAAALAASLTAVVAAVGCTTSDESEVPLACRSDPETVRRALESAPGSVRLDGTPISRCLTRSSDAADIQAVGGAVIEAGAELAREARTAPEGPEALRLGYLVGAVRKGAGRTQGIHDELVRRLEQELHGVDTGSEAFRHGERAGRERG